MLEREREDSTTSAMFEASTSPPFFGPRKFRTTTKEQSASQAA